MECYNTKQKRKDRMIDDYFEKIRSGKYNNAYDMLSDYMRYNLFMEWGIKAYTEENHFQKVSRLVVQFTNEDEIRVHVWSNYKKKNRKR